MSHQIKIELLWHACTNDAERKAVLAEARRQRSPARRKLSEWEYRGGVERALAALARLNQSREPVKFVPLTELQDKVFSVFNGHPIDTKEIYAKTKELPRGSVRKTLTNLVKFQRLRKVSLSVYERVKVGLLLAFLSCSFTASAQVKGAALLIPISAPVNLKTNKVLTWDSDESRFAVYTGTNRANLRTRSTVATNAVAYDPKLTYGIAAINLANVESALAYWPSNNIYRDTWEAWSDATFTRKIGEYAAPWGLRTNNASVPQTTFIRVRTDLIRTE